MKRNIFPLLSAALLLTGSVLFTGCGTTAPVNTTQNASTATEDSTASQYTNNTITVNSSETVTLVPDIAQVVYAVRTEAKDASDCQQKNTEDVNKVIDLLKSLGVEEKSIQTSDYYMYPIYNYSGNTQRLTGYEATTSLTISDLPMENLGNILTQSVSSGINHIQSITYQSSKYDEGYADALQLAVASAKVKAQALADAGDCTLGQVINIHENSNYSEARYTDSALSSKMQATTEMALEDSAGANIMPGEIDIAVNITVTYLIK